MNSILQSEKKCYVTELTDGLHKHHIYGAANRKISEDNGFWVWLTPEYHKAKFEETHSREEFMRLIGRSYL